MPLNNDAAEAELSRVQNEKRLPERRMDATAQAIALEVRNAVLQVELNRARIETAQATRQLAERRHEAEQTKFQLGTSTLDSSSKNSEIPPRPKPTSSKR